MLKVGVRTSIKVFWELVSVLLQLLNNWVKTVSLPTKCEWSGHLSNIRDDLKNLSSASKEYMPRGGLSYIIYL